MGIPVTSDDETRWEWIGEQQPVGVDPLVVLFWICLFIMATLIIWKFKNGNSSK